MLVDHLRLHGWCEGAAGASNAFTFPEDYDSTYQVHRVQVVGICPDHSQPWPNHVDGILRQIKEVCKVSPRRDCGYDRVSVGIGWCWVPSVPNRQVHCYSCPSHCCHALWVTRPQDCTTAECKAHPCMIIMACTYRRLRHVRTLVCCRVSMTGWH